MAIRLGINPIGWSNDDMPELGGETPLETCLAETKQAGFSGIEKGGKFPNDPNTMRLVLGKHGLQLITGWFSGELRARSIEDEKKRIADHLNLLMKSGAKVAVYAETTGTVQADMDTPVADRPVMPESEFPAYGEKLTKFAEWMKAEGIPMTFHHHMGTVIEKEREVDLLMQNTGPAVGLLLDTGHLTFAGGDVPATTRRWGQRINHVHCKNIRPLVLAEVHRNHWSFLKGVLEGVFTVPGDPEGCIDYRPFARILKEIGYSGWAVVEAEQDPAKANPLKYATMGCNELREAFTAAGFQIQG
ncbi:MAG: myo-inosose-2 dehydratase [Geminicoccaceae bacterium]